MNSIVEIIIYFIAVIGIFFTYISLKYYDEIYNGNEKYDYFESDVKKIEIVIKSTNYEKTELDEIIEVIKKGKFDNLSDIVDDIKVEKM